MSTQDCLFEIGCEELPARFVQALAKSLAANTKNGLEQKGLAHGKITAFGTPRRLAVLIEGLATAQPPQQIERRGPSVGAAYDQQGVPTLACIGFARSCGVSADQLQVKETPKGSWLFYEGHAAGEQTALMLPEILQKAIADLPIHRPMRWGNGEQSFIRPIRWVLLRLGEQVVDMEVLGIKSQGNSFGHAFHKPGPVQIPVLRDYARIMQDRGMVVVEIERRRQAIREALEVAAEGIGRPVIDAELLAEVTSLVEWPVILRGHFDPRFLSVPPEVLMTSMETHQKCFPIVDESGKVQPAFLLVSNIESKNPKLVIRGNERVIAARLEDAAFFYEKDRKTPLADHFDGLSGVVFAQKLGTLADKATRLQKLTARICDLLGVDKKIGARAAYLCKCDLLTYMVGEFPSLQGTMGYYYAKEAGEPKEVVQAISDHYLPRFSADVLPTDLYSAALALADRMDTLVGILGLNKKPRGDKDPFALRRAALGIVRIMIGLELSLDCRQLLKKAISLYGDALVNENTLNDALTFISERLKAWYLDQGVSPQVFMAVAATDSATLLDFSKRVQAVMGFQALPEAEALAAANKRVVNILKKSKTKGLKAVDVAHLELSAEKKLVKLLDKTQKQLDKQLGKQNYPAALSELARLKEPVDEFFTDVMIMADDPQIRDNRLAILVQLKHLFTAVADISQL